MPENGFEVITEIKDNLIESRELGTAVIYLKKDFLSYFNTPDYHMFEFILGKFLHLKKTFLKTKTIFKAFLHEITGEPPRTDFGKEEMPRTDTAVKVLL